MTDERIFHLPLTLKEAKGDTGVVAGFASTPDVDGIGDKVLPTAFDNSVKSLTDKNKKLPMRYQHKEPIGAFEKFSIDEKGLFVEGQINLDTQRGKEVYSLVKQGAMGGMSIGGRIVKGAFEIEDGKDIFVIKDFDLREVTITDTPMNVEAEITRIKEAFSERKREQETETGKEFWEKLTVGYAKAKEAVDNSQKEWFAGVLKGYAATKHSGKSQQGGI